METKINLDFPKINLDFPRRSAIVAFMNNEVRILKSKGRLAAYRVQFGRWVPNQYSWKVTGKNRNDFKAVYEEVAHTKEDAEKRAEAMRKQWGQTT